MTKEYKRLSKVTKEYLKSGETLTVDFKENVKGIKQEKLVAFANSPHGGTFLIGVKEKEKDGIQRGEVVGCSATDTDVLSILNKAKECVPPIEVKVFIENTSMAERLLRVEVPTGMFKPYCTGGGVYCVRRGVRTDPLHPRELLHIFLENEGADFLNRFKAATIELSAAMDDAVDSVNEVGDRIEQFEERMDITTGNIEDAVDRVEGMVEDAASAGDESSGIVDELYAEVGRMELRILRHISSCSGEGSDEAYLTASKFEEVLEAIGQLNGTICQVEDIVSNLDG